MKNIYRTHTPNGGYSIQWWAAMGAICAATVVVVFFPQIIGA